MKDYGSPVEGPQKLQSDGLSLLLPELIHSTPMTCVHLTAGSSSTSRPRSWGGLGAGTCALEFGRFHHTSSSAWSFHQQSISPVSVFFSLALLKLAIFTLSSFSAVLPKQLCGSSACCHSQCRGGKRSVIFPCPLEGASSRFDRSAFLQHHGSFQANALQLKWASKPRFLIVCLRLCL